MSYCTVSNTSANAGAAIKVSYDSRLEVNHCTLANLQAYSKGGISLSLKSNARIHDTIFFNCDSRGTAAGIIVEAEGELVLSNTVFESMTARTSSAIYLDDATLDVSHSRFIHCSSEISGGLISLVNSHLIMDQSILDQFTGSAITGADKSTIEMLDVTI